MQIKNIIISFLFIFQSVISTPRRNRNNVDTLEVEHVEVEHVEVEHVEVEHVEVEHVEVHGI